MIEIVVKKVDPKPAWTELQEVPPGTWFVTQSGCVGYKFVNPNGVYGGVWIDGSSKDTWPIHSDAIIGWAYPCKSINIEVTR